MTEPTQTQRVIGFIAANPGCTALDLMRGLDPFVANPRARISDARQQGHTIECRRRSDGVNGFWVVPRRIVDVGEQSELFAEAS